MCKHLQLSSMCHICNTTCILYMYYSPIHPLEKNEAKTTIHPLHPPQRHFQNLQWMWKHHFHQPAPNDFFCWIMVTTSISTSKPKTPHKSTRWAPTSFKWGYDPLEVGLQTHKNSFISGQIAIIPKPELRTFWGDSLTKPHFGMTLAEVAIIRTSKAIYKGFLPPC